MAYYTFVGTLFLIKCKRPQIAMSDADQEILAWNIISSRLTSPSPADSTMQTITLQLIPSYELRGL